MVLEDAFDRERRKHNWKRLEKRTINKRTIEIIMYKDKDIRIINNEESKEFATK